MEVTNHCVEIFTIFSSDSDEDDVNFPRSAYDSAAFISKPEEQWSAQALHGIVCRSPSFNRLQNSSRPSRDHGRPSKRGRNVVLISSQLVTDQDKKPEIILHYNSTKGTVDSLDKQLANNLFYTAEDLSLARGLVLQLCRHQCIYRPTTDWPFTIQPSKLNSKLIVQYYAFIAILHFFLKQVHCENFTIDFLILCQI